MATINRSLAKTISWRIIATLDTFIISFFITKELKIAGIIAALEVLTKTFLYFFHERMWNKIKLK
ncbi:DUF2061 domain-containing protein [Pelagibacteraceae bacterium]|jgi:uncharacterized membrane protein|nr:DUF2061 domain-containing protein [Pelagibacteraceae bacterium]